MFVPLGLTTGLYAILGLSAAVRGYGRWLKRMWRSSP
jgi:hypothetical protein